MGQVEWLAWYAFQIALAVDRARFSYLFEQIIDYVITLESKKRDDSWVLADKFIKAGGERAFVAFRDKKNVSLSEQKESYYYDNRKFLNRLKAILVLSEITFD